MGNDWVIKYAIKAVDNFTPSAKNVAISSHKAKKAVDRLGKSIQKLSKQKLSFDDIGGALVGGAGLANAFNQFADFEKLMSDVSTLVDTNVENMGQMTKQVEQMSRRTGQPLNEIAVALYDVRSAGIQAADSMGVLEKSAQLALAGKGTTQQAVDVMTSAINAFGLQGAELERINDIIFKTVQAGKTDIAQLSQGFGEVAPTMATAGVAVDELMSAVGTLTGQGMTASTVYTRMRAVIDGLTRQNKIAGRVFRQVGAKDVNEFIEKSGGLIQALEITEKTLKGNKKAILEMFGSTEAFGAIMSLTGEGNKKYNDTLNAMRIGSNEVNKAFEKQMKTAHAMRTTMSNAIQLLNVQLGRMLVPAVNILTISLTKLLDAIQYLNTEFPVLTKIIGYTLLGLIGLRVGMVAAMFAGQQLAIAAMAVGKGLMFLWGIMLANPVTAVVVAVGALGVGLGWLIGKFDIVGKSWEFMKEAAGKSLDFIMDKFNKVVAAIKTGMSYLNPANWFGDEEIDTAKLEKQIEGMKQLQAQGISPQQVANRAMFTGQLDVRLAQGLQGNLLTDTTGMSMNAGINLGGR